MNNTSKQLIKSLSTKTTMLQLATYTDSKAFNNGLARLEQDLSIGQSIEMAPLISQLGDKKQVIREIIRIIEFFLSVTGKDLETFQTIILAGDLYEKFKHDTLEDVILMFKMARQGDFGKVYKLDNFEVMDWANRYLEKKSEERERILRSKKEPKSEEPQKGEKYFHELPQELQEELRKMLKPADNPYHFLPEKAVEMMTRAKFIQELKNY